MGSKYGLEYQALASSLARSFNPLRGTLASMASSFESFDDSFTRRVTFNKVLKPFEDSGVISHIAAMRAPLMNEPIRPFSAFAESLRSIEAISASLGRSLKATESVIGALSVLFASTPRQSFGRRLRPGRFSSKPWNPSARDRHDPLSPNAARAGVSLNLASGAGPGAASSAAPSAPAAPAPPAGPGATTARASVATPARPAARSGAAGCAPAA